MSDSASPSRKSPDSELTVEQHRALAISLYNRSQDLYYSQRSFADDQEMLTAALASRFHWLHAGGPTQWATSDWCVSRVLAVFGAGEPAVEWAKSALTHVTPDFPAWRRASALEGLARAHAAAGQLNEAAAALQQSREILAEEPNPHEVEIIAEQIADTETIIAAASSR